MTITNQSPPVWPVFGSTGARLRLLVLAVLLLLFASATAVHARVPPTASTKATQTKMEAALTAEIQRVVNNQNRIEGQADNLVVVAEFENETEGRWLVIDLGAGFIPPMATIISADLEDQLHQLETEASDLLRDVVPVSGIKFRFSGKEIFDYFPQEQEFMPADKKVSSLSTVPAKVVVAAGHGIYYHYGFKDWRAQRNPSNGVTEDFITPDYASELSTWLNVRSGIKANSPRSAAMTVHAASGQPWWKLAARYNLAKTYPGNPEIWHSLPTATDNLRERNEDIRSRPLFANFIGADVLLHVHTNASSDLSATGTRAYYYTGRSEDKRLADSILCYIRELIHAQSSYANYLVPDQSSPSVSEGENRLASMPSVIVEVGFHTNPKDAGALKDPVFRAAAMKGVEKGYRLYSQRQPCQTLMISSIPNVSGPNSVPIPIKVHYKGYPQFPVKVKVEIPGCPSGWTCAGGEATFNNNPPSPLSYIWTCRVAFSHPSAVFKFRTTLSDADGVVSNAVEHTVRCTTVGA